MTLDAGFYGAAQAFREVSGGPPSSGARACRAASGPRAPILMRDLGSSAGFVRAASARAAGLDHRPRPPRRHPLGLAPTS